MTTQHKDVTGSRKVETPTAASKAPETTRIALADIVVDESLIPRRLNCAQAALYADLMLSGASFPPLFVWKHESECRLLGGRTRLEAMQIALPQADAERAALEDTVRARELDQIIENLSSPTALLSNAASPEAARLEAFADNVGHGRPYTLAEKKDHLGWLLTIPDHEQLSGRELGRMVGLDHKTVLTFKQKLTQQRQPGWGNSPAGKSTKGNKTHKQTVELHMEAPLSAATWLREHVELMQLPAVFADILREYEIAEDFANEVQELTQTAIESIDPSEAASLLPQRNARMIDVSKCFSVTVNQWRKTSTQEMPNLHVEQR